MQSTRSTDTTNLIMDRDGPEINKDKHAHEQKMMHWEDETEDIVRHSCNVSIRCEETLKGCVTQEKVMVTLCPTVNRVESV